jgi:hypothetical protein
MVAPPEIPRNASRTQSEGRANKNGKKRENCAARGIIKARNPKAPPKVLEELR